MATSVYKTILDSDKAATRTLLHEYIPITGTLVSGTYGGDTITLGSEPHIQTYAHGMFQSVYDYPYLSSSANHIMDVSVGISSDSQISGAADAAGCKGRGGTSTANTCTAFMQDKKLNMYSQMAQILQGYDASGAIAKFDEDGDLTGDGGTKINECVFVSLTRLLTKDEIKKGSFSMDLNVSQSPTSQANIIRITDSDGSDQYYNAASGEYGVLYASDVHGTQVTNGRAHTSGESANSKRVGLLFYQAGVAVISGSVFGVKAGSQGGLLQNVTPQVGAQIQFDSGDEDIPADASFHQLLTGSNIQDAANMFRQRMFNLRFNNTTELNSMVYFCRAKHNEFNYSGNRTYLNGSKIRVKNQAQDMPRSYITTVGLYSANNELMAVAKLSEPIRKDPTNEVTLRVRLDY